MTEFTFFLVPKEKALPLFLYVLEIGHRSFLLTVFSFCDLSILFVLRSRWMLTLLIFPSGSILY